MKRVAGNNIKKGDRVRVVGNKVYSFRRNSDVYIDDFVRGMMALGIKVEFGLRPIYQQPKLEDYLL